MKPFTLVLLPLVGLWYWVHTGAFRKAAVATALALVACIVTLAPWTVRNYFTLGGFVPTATNGGVVLWINNNPEATGSYQFPTKNPLDGLRKPNGKPDEVAPDRLARRLALQWIRENPQRFVQLGLIRLRHTFLITWDTDWSMAVMPDGQPSPYQPRVDAIKV